MLPCPTKQGRNFSLKTHLRPSTQRQRQADQSLRSKPTWSTLVSGLPRVERPCAPKPNTHTYLYGIPPENSLAYFKVTMCTSFVVGRRVNVGEGSWEWRCCGLYQRVCKAVPLCARSRRNLVWEKHLWETVAVGRHWIIRALWTVNINACSKDSPVLLGRNIHCESKVQK